MSGTQRVLECGVFFPWFIQLVGNDTEASGGSGVQVGDSIERYAEVVDVFAVVGEENEVGELVDAEELSVAQGIAVGLLLLHLNRGVHRIIGPWHCQTCEAGRMKPAGCRDNDVERSHD